MAWLLIVLGGVWVAWLGGHFESLGDYASEFAPAMDALLAGHLHAFSLLQPADGAGGSVLLRAPGALAGKLLVGGQLAMFRFGALACELAAGALGLALARDMRRRGVSIVSRAAVVGLCVLAAAILDAIFFAHPEETLGATLCIAAVLLSGSNRPALAGIALGCAIINKPWGILAIAPVLLASQSGVRRMSAGAILVVVPWLTLAYGLDPARMFRAMRTASSLAIVAHPVDLWWPLDHAVRRPGIATYYAPPSFLVDHARQIASCWRFRSRSRLRTRAWRDCDRPAPRTVASLTHAGSPLATARAWTPRWHCWPCCSCCVACSTRRITSTTTCPS